jgi:hypothetical protein
VYRRLGGAKGAWYEQGIIFFSMEKHTGYQIKKNEMGWACSKYEDEKKCIQTFGEGI